MNFWSGRELLINIVVYEKSKFDPFRVRPSITLPETAQKTLISDHIFAKKLWYMILFELVFIVIGARLFTPDIILPARNLNCSLNRGIECGVFCSL